jgi:hypothetical protein
MNPNMDLLAQHYAWVSTQPHYTADGKYEGWTVTAKQSTGECFYATDVDIEGAALILVRRVEPAEKTRKKIRIKR